ncbi:MAG: hypothetical protein WHS88_10755 [Anaerohalosphaeraceae bacterium]
MKKRYDNLSIMTVGYFKKVLSELEKKSFDDYQIWLSRDEEGNEYMPMMENINLSIGIDDSHKRIVLFP